MRVIGAQLAAFRVLQDPEAALRPHGEVEHDAQSSTHAHYRLSWFPNPEDGWSHRLRRVRTGVPQGLGEPRSRLNRCCGGWTGRTAAVMKRARTPGHSANVQLDLAG